MKELIIKKGDKQITVADKEDVMDALSNKADKSSYVTCTVTYVDESTETINFVVK